MKNAVPTMLFRIMPLPFITSIGQLTSLGYLDLIYYCYRNAGELMPGLPLSIQAFAYVNYLYATTVNVVALLYCNCCLINVTTHTGE